MARSEARTTAPGTGTDAELVAVLKASAGSPEATREHVLSLRRSARAALDAQLQRVLAAQGRDARAACARELCVGLADVSVGELLQTIALGRKDAVIDVFDAGAAGRVWCSGGEIIDARSGRLEGEPAAYRVLAAERGEMVADFRSVQRARTIAASTQALMLEAARRKDECAVLEGRLGGARAVYVATATTASAPGTGGVDARVLTAFAGGARLDAVRSASLLDDLSLLSAICSLVERGLLVPSRGSASHCTPRYGTPAPGASPHGPTEHRTAIQGSTAQGATTRAAPQDAVALDGGPRDAAEPDGSKRPPVASGTALDTLSRLAAPLTAAFLRRRPSSRALAALAITVSASVLAIGLLQGHAEPAHPADPTQGYEPSQAVAPLRQARPARAAPSPASPSEVIPSETIRSETIRPEPAPSDPPSSEPRPLQTGRLSAPHLPLATSAQQPADTTTDTSYPVHVVVDPAHSELWLDGARIASGELSIILALDGQTHELRVTAPLHQPQTYLFRDAPPPRAIRLEPLQRDPDPPAPTTESTPNPDRARPRERRTPGGG